MLEKISDIKPFDYGPLLTLLRQFPSVTLMTPSDTKSNLYCHVRPGKARGVPVRDLDGQQLRILLEKLGIKVYAKVTDPVMCNMGFKCDNYVDEMPEGSLPIVFPYGNFMGGQNGGQYKWFAEYLPTGRPYLWWYNDVRMNPANGAFTSKFPELANAETIGLVEGCKYQINFNTDMLKESKVVPSDPRFCYIGGPRTDLKTRMRCFPKDKTACFGMLDKTVNKFYFESIIPPSKVVDVYSNFFATIFSISADSVLNGITARFYEVMCSNAVVFFDTPTELEFESWEFRKLSSPEEAAEKLQYLIDHPDYRQQLIDEQHDYIKRLNDRINAVVIPE